MPLVNELPLWPMIYSALTEAYEKDSALRVRLHGLPEEFGELDYESIAGGGGSVALSDKALDAEYWASRIGSGPNINNLFCWANAPEFYLDLVNVYWRNKDPRYSLLDVNLVPPRQAPLFSEDA